MLPSKNARTTKPARTKPPTAALEPQGQTVTPDIAWLQQAAHNARAARPADLLQLQRQSGNRAVNRLVDSVQRQSEASNTPSTPPSISRISSGGALPIQRELTDEAFNNKLKEYGFRNFPKELIKDLLQVINLVIKKYPTYETALVNALDDALYNVNGSFSIQSNLPGFLKKLAEILTDNGLEKFEPPEAVFDIGKKQPKEEKKKEYIPDEDLDSEELAARKGLPQELGTVSGKLVSKDQRPTAKLTMGQGLVANLGQVILYSDEFSTCSPIVMFNATNYQGGLFHFPAGALSKQAGNLKNMYQRAKPTMIYVNERKDAMAKEPSKDASNLIAFFIKELGFTGKIVPIALMSDAYSVTLADDMNSVEIETDISSKGPVLSVYHDNTGEGRKKVAHNWEGAPAATKFGRDDWHT